MENNTFNTKETALLAQDGFNSQIDCVTNYDYDNNIKNIKNQSINAKCIVYALSDFMNLELPKQEMLLSPIIPTKSLTMLHAYRGVGKSFFAMSIAYAVATGSKFLRWESNKPAKVLYVDGEMSSTALQERFSRIAENFEASENSYTENLKIFSADLQEFATIDIANTCIQEEIDKMLDGISLVVFDNLSSLTKVDELDATSWVSIQDWLFDLRKRGIAVLIVHHSGKNGGQRGISKREDILDLVIHLEHSRAGKKSTKEDEENSSFGGNCKVVFEKNRNLGGKQIASFDIALVDTDNGGISWVDVYSIVKTMKNFGGTCRSIGEITGISKSTISNILQKEKSV